MTTRQVRKKISKVRCPDDRIFQLGDKVSTRPVYLHDKARRGKIIHFLSQSVYRVRFKSGKEEVLGYHQLWKEE